MKLFEEIFYQMSFLNYIIVYICNQMVTKEKKDGKN